MANPEHLALFKQYVEAKDFAEWNASQQAEWQKEISLCADLSDANLEGAYLRGANLTNAKIGYTQFDDVDLSQVKGLESVDHGTPSYIDYSTFYKSRGNIPEVFLRGC